MDIDPTIPEGLGPEFDRVLDPWSGLEKVAKQVAGNRQPFLFISCKDAHPKSSGLIGIMIDCVCAGDAEEVTAMLAFVIERWAQQNGRTVKEVYEDLLALIQDIRMGDN